MDEAAVLVSDNYLRGAWMLNNQVSTVEDLIRFWNLFGGPLVKVPDLELRPDWDVLY